jgi:hypothetical protein
LIRQTIADEAPHAWAYGVKLALKPLRMSDVVAMSNLASRKSDAEITVRLKATAGLFVLRSHARKSNYL